MAITVPVGPDSIYEVSVDETIRPDTTVDGLGKLPPSFENEEMRRRFPQIEWRLTAGNSSQITDGASAMLITTDCTANRLGLRPRARFRAFSVVGDDPIMMLTGPIPATTRVLERSGLKLDQIDHYEVNEAFASVPLAWQLELGADPERLNPQGGAISLGHRLGATGTRLMTHMIWPWRTLADASDCRPCVNLGVWLTRRLSNGCKSRSWLRSGMKKSSAGAR